MNKLLTKIKPYRMTILTINSLKINLKIKSRKLINNKKTSIISKKEMENLIPTIIPCFIVSIPILQKSKNFIPTKKILSSCFLIEDIPIAKICTLSTFKQNHIHSCLQNLIKALNILKKSTFSLVIKRLFLAEKMSSIFRKLFQYGIKLEITQKQ